MSMCPEGCEIHVTLGRVATEALAAYTSSHIGGVMPLAMDGRILTSPTIQGAITGGDLVISFASQGGSISAAALAAILESGPLPTGWTVE
jgi:SecD/SecF fusion protein